MTAFGKLFDWYDVLNLTVEETEFLNKLQHWKYAYPNPKGDFDEPNPFDQRGIWAGKED